MQCRPPLAHTCTLKTSEVAASSALAWGREMSRTNKADNEHEQVITGKQNNRGCKRKHEEFPPRLITECLKILRSDLIERGVGFFELDAVLAMENLSSCSSRDIVQRSIVHFVFATVARGSPSPTT